MIFHENRLLADDCHGISCLNFFYNWERFFQNLSSAAVVIGAFRVKNINFFNAFECSILLLHSREMYII